MSFRDVTHIRRSLFSAPLIAHCSKKVYYFIKPTPNYENSLPGRGSKRLNKVDNLPESKVNDFWIISLAYANSLLDIIFFLFVNRFSKGILNHDKIILV